MTRSGNYYRNS